MKTTYRFSLILFAGILALSMCSAGLQAQPYGHSVGIRAGYSSGISYKGFFRHQMTAVEGDILYNRHGFNLSGLYEVHLEPFRNEHILVYLGGGAFGGNWDEEFSIGILGIAGVEYYLRDTPLIFGLDWRPMLNIYRNFAYDFLDFGLCIRYRFGN